ncbi:MAG: CapA family protein [Clostridiales bacterium]|nr:CapA family protein [Clostridiales bacterium]
MSIIIGADIVPVLSNMSLFESDHKENLIGEELCDIMDAADYRIFNLEVPLTDSLSPIKKHGPVLAASTKSIIGLKAIGVDLFTLANNHIMDQDIQGLKSTIQLLDQYNIFHVGAGNSVSEASEPFYFTVKGKRFGVYSCAEHEFSIAKEDKPGANPFDPLESPDHVHEMKSRCDYAIVLYHGGKEQYRYPSPMLQQTCRKLADKGADLVICQHSHCVGCKEEYKNKTIIYGQGNFHFTKRSNEFWDSGLLIHIDETEKISYIPVVKSGNTVRMANRAESDEIMKGFDYRSEEITRNGFVEDNYKVFADEMLSEYMLYFLGIQNNLLLRAINKLSGQRLRKYIAKHVKTKRGLGITNFIECEAHRELLIKGLENKQ